MADIKTRDSVKDIKVLDKANVAGERMKKAFIRSKNTAENLMDDRLRNTRRTRYATLRRMW